MTVSFTTTGGTIIYFGKRTLSKINKQIGDTKRDAFRGIGKPEPFARKLEGLVVHKDNTRTSLGLQSRGK